jgi:FtsZ-binding cell division protein ZapB
MDRPTQRTINELQLALELTQRRNYKLLQDLRIANENNIALELENRQLKRALNKIPKFVKRLMGCQIVLKFR